MVTWPLNCFILRLVEGKIWFDKAVWTSVFQHRKPKDNIYSLCLSWVSVSFLYFDKWCRFWCSCARSTVFNSCGRVFKCICSLEDVCSWKVGHFIIISTGVGCECVWVVCVYVCVCVCYFWCLGCSPTYVYTNVPQCTSTTEQLVDDMKPSEWQGDPLQTTTWDHCLQHSVTQHIHSVVVQLPHHYIDNIYA